MSQLRAESRYLLSVITIESMGSKAQGVSEYGEHVAANIARERDKRGLSDRELARILSKASSYVTERSLLRREWSLSDVANLAHEWGLDVQQLLS